MLSLPVVKAPGAWWRAGELALKLVLERGEDIQRARLAEPARRRCERTATRVSGLRAQHDLRGARLPTA